MAQYQYQIGTVAAGVAAMTNVEELVSALATHGQCTPPHGLAVERFSVYRTAASGLEVGDGYPQTAWVFDVLEQAQLDALLSYLGSSQSARVLISTRLDSGAYATYQAVMHRPRPGQEMEPGLVGRWRSVTIKFTMLEAVANP